MARRNKKSAELQIDDIIKDINKIGDKKFKTMLSRNARQGAKFLLKKVKRLTKTVTGKGREQWVIKRKLIKAESTVYFNIQPDTKKGSGEKPYMRFVDSGTKYMKPSLIRSKAFDLHGKEAFDLVNDKIEKAVTRLFKKMKWKRSGSLK